MDIGFYNNEVINIKSLLLSTEDKDNAIDRYRKIAEKGHITCPFCMEKLYLRAGDVRDIHLAHRRGRTCQIAKAYDTYQAQVTRENKRHSVIKEIIYTDLKGQERFKTDLRVKYGYEEKGHESWKHYPDIYLNKNGREFAICLITNIHEIGDTKIVNLINKRNKYFVDKGLETIWFIEERELAYDYDHRVLFLWEAEYGLAIKTKEDREWDKLVKDLIEEFPNVSVTDLFGYRSYGSLDIDVRSLYYVHSEGNNITISTHRIILDRKKSPYRAYALTKGYKQNISYALIVEDEILLCDQEIEEKARLEFANEVAFRVDELMNYTLDESELIVTVGESIEYRTEETSKTTDLKEDHDRRFSIDEDTLSEVLVVDIDFTDYLLKVKRRTITVAEARQLNHYVRLNKGELIHYGFTIQALSKIIDESIGRIDDPAIRTWLVDIQYL
ncbi:competence protein CoiA family protein [Paenibacillus glucanolyticus]|jgi:hypothetical protein|uniref:Competence protein CoiA-like N-terminal domain-containing protein n=2 Tax=Bacteria TaxID=2 RepID=A0A163G6P3_9BACL|nr:MULTISPECIES: competence protein CoiA family protein [Paenibacillus]KZS44763.1 hypothetical protein AWU65_01870 [Paenibacillus glucanolyticus]MDH6675644.1 hypothetical protein [Paenibacillus sp. LBL]OMF64754.1 hypothetical protein BK142_31705 [Paenibacillus glucanolyticus]